MGFRIFFQKGKEEIDLLEFSLTSDWKMLKRKKENIP